MKAILRPHVGVSLTACVTAALLAVPLVAAPLHYQVNLLAEPASHALSGPLAGANLQLNVTWDAAALVPHQSDPTKTVWPTSNAVGSLTVSGSAAVDGVYNANFATEASLSWTNTDNAPSIGDGTRFPAMSFRIAGERIGTTFLQATFADTFFSAPHPFLPKPFASADVTWSKLRFFHLGFFQAGVDATVLSGFAEAVPEPTAIAMGSIALLGLTALRRRK